MKLTIERAALLKALAHVQSVVERRNTIPILSNVLITAQKGRLSLAATDMDLAITANTERMWANLCAVLGRTDLAGDARFATNAQRYANRDALWDILEAAFRAKPAATMFFAI